MDTAMGICGHSNRQNQHEAEKSKIDWLFHFSHPLCINGDVFPYNATQPIERALLPVTN
jgi:hypothetical protein